MGKWYWYAHFLPFHPFLSHPSFLSILFVLPLRWNISEENSGEDGKKDKGRKGRKGEGRKLRKETKEGN
jgi:hypothetical protein